MFNFKAHQRNLGEGVFKSEFASELESDDSGDLSDVPALGEYKKKTDTEIINAIMEAQKPQDPDAPVRGMFVLFHFVLEMLLI